jgi:hypothetical protein
MKYAQLKKFYETLSSEEEITINQVRQWLDSDNDKKAIEMMQAWTQDTFVKFVCQSEKIDNFAGSALALRLHPQWAETLNSHRSPSSSVSSMVNTDFKKESYSILDHYISDALIMNFLKLKSADDGQKKRGDLLHEACQLGSYDGLVIRCNINTQQLLKQADSNDNLINDIKKDSERLISLYGAIGYVQAGSTMLEVGSHLLGQADDDNVKLGADYYELGVTYLLCATLLEKDNYSNTVMNSVTAGAGPLAVFKKSDIDLSAFKNAISAQNELKNWVGEDTYKVLYGRATSAVQSIRRAHDNNSTLSATSQPRLFSIVKKSLPLPVLSPEIHKLENNK